MGNQKTLVSVIIPCYNQGNYLDETVESVLNQTFRDFEIIIVNDGSTDSQTNSKLKEYDQPHTRVINIKNQGLAGARNTGICNADGKYILPLDSDDIIGPTYLEDAVRVLESNEQIGIVYCDVELFGEKKGVWPLSPYSLNTILLRNLIFASSFFRKKDWEKVGGYNTRMVYGWEDWDFWLSLIELGINVYKIPKTLFYYRIREGSMVQRMTIDQRVKMFSEIFNNHQSLYMENKEVMFKALLEKGYGPLSIAPSYIAQLYVDRGNGFSEQEVYNQEITRREMFLTYELKQSSDIQQLRFDPIDDYAHLKLHSISILDKDNKLKENLPFRSNALKRNQQGLIFTTNDPQIYISSPALTTAKKIIFRVEYLRWGEEFLRKEYVPLMERRMNRFSPKSIMKRLMGK